MRLSDEQREALLQCCFCETYDDFISEAAPLVEQWISEAVADALESGNLPEGWERREEARAMEPYRADTISATDPRPPRFFRPDGSEIDTSTWPRRIVITGPWQEVDR